MDSTKPSATDLLVLSYNISFEAMTNNNNGKLNPGKLSAGHLGSKCKPVSPGSRLTICAKHMAASINAMPVNLGVSNFDFVGLQEASRWDVLQSAADTSLNKMAVVHSQPDRAEMASFYDASKYTLIKKYLGKFQFDRPFHILVFQLKSDNTTGVIFINVHNPHHQTKSYANFTFNDMMIDLSKGLSTLSLTDEEKKYRIIGVGDHNETGWDWTNKTLSPKSWTPFANAKIITTISLKDTICSCCMGGGNWDDVKNNVSPTGSAIRGGDYIFDSKAPADLQVPKGYDPKLLQSDHLPVIAILPG